MTTLQYQVAASADDAFENTGGAVNITATNILAVSASGQYGGIRFTGVAVPQGATIVSAAVQVMPPSATSDSPNHLFKAQAADNPGAFTTGSFDISTRGLTTASATWTATDIGGDGATFFTTPDMAAVIQEIVDRGGWASGNAIVIVYSWISGGSSALAVRSYDSAAGNAAKLDITYVIGKATRSVYHHLVGGMR